jgi:hypothetical protein
MKIRYLTVGMTAALIFMAVGLNAATVALAASDITPPSTPGGFRIEQRNMSSLRLNWNWTPDAGGYVAKWELSYAGRTVVFNHTYPGDTINITNLNLQAGNAYIFELKAIDDSGNRSLVPARLVFETTPPGRASNLRLVSMRGNYPDIIAFDAAPDNSGNINSYEVFLNGESLGTTGSSQTQFSLFEQVYLIACIEPSSGPATLELRATDSSFNVSQQFSTPLTVIFP